MKKRILSLLLVAALMFSLCIIPASAEAETPLDGGEYPIVFVHGLLGWGYNDAISDLMCYWGMTSGNMLNLLTGKGYSVVNTSVGPLSSCWDRCCELFAQLTGTVTDYGAAHSAQVEAAYANSSNDLKHDRFGRDYTGGALVKDWGPVYENGKVVGWYDNKLNLIGHSFGGPTSVEFLQLLAEGDQNEIAWGKEQAALYGGDWHDYVSPLFWGDYEGQYLINSVTSLAGVLNGTTLLSCCKDECELIMTLITYIANTLGLTDISYLYDFQLEHFGITKTPGKSLTDEQYFSSDKVKQFLAGYDNALYDLSISGCNYLKQGWDTYDNVYYFSYAGNRTHRDQLTGNYLPDVDMLLLLRPFALKMGRADYAFEQVKNIRGGYYTNTNKEWFPNDGLLNTISARYPMGAAQKPYDADDIEPGIWQWMDMRYDHMTFAGGLLDLNPNQPAEARRFFTELAQNVSASTPIDDPNRDPFIDIAYSDYHDYIVEAARLGIVYGHTDGRFRPDDPTSRAQFVTMLWRMAGEPRCDAKLKFTDSDSIDAVYRDAVAWGQEKGIVLGYDDNTFRPDETVSRAQMAAFLYRYLKTVAGYDFGAFGDAGYADAADIEDCYTEAVNAITAAGIMKGTGGNMFSPNEDASRAMVATVLVRMAKLY